MGVWEYGSGELGIHFALKGVLIHSTNIKVKKQSYEKNVFIIYDFSDRPGGLRTGKASESA